MTNLIKDQLKKCRIADTSAVNEEQNVNIIHKKKSIEPYASSCVKSSEIAVGGKYIISVESYIIYPYDGFTLHDNWNHGIVPTDSDMECSVLMDMGKMVKVQAIGIHDGSMWEGWLPKKSIKSARKI